MSVRGQQHHDRSALVLFGSETGNTQDVAEELGRVAERLRFLTRVVDLDAVEIEELAWHTIVIIAVCTTGQGELPGNARLFWRKLLRKRLPPTLLQDVTFTTFGLGDSSYPKFNWAARKLHRRLTQLGAREICARGEADERHPEGVDGALIPWTSLLRAHLSKSYPMPDGLLAIPDNEVIPPKWVLEFAVRPDQAALLSSDAKSPYGPVEASHHQRSNGSVVESRTKSSDDSPGHEALPPDDLLPIPNAIRMTLDQNDRVTPLSHWQDVRRLAFSTKCPLDYGPGDVLKIFPKNFPEDVGQFIALMGWEDIADRAVRFVRTNPSVEERSYPPPPVESLLPLPEVTLRNLLTHHLDIMSIPRRSLLSVAAHFTSDTSHKERLLELTNPEFIDELYDYTTRPRRSVLELLQEFDSVKLPWQWIGTIIPPIRGRQFSIASGGPLKHRKDERTVGRIDLLVAIVKYRTVIKRVRQGVCTRYLAALPLGTSLNVLLQTGGLDVTTSEANRPVVLVAPGTGVAPMRSMLWERLDWQLRSVVDRAGVNGTDTSKPPFDVGKSVLFFGGRNREADFFFERDWQDLKTKLDLEVYTAFSRDQTAKIYVQDRIREHSALIHHLLHDDGGLVYICGSSGRMPQAIREALIEVFQHEGGSSREEAEAYLASMEKTGRYKQETW